MAAAVACFISEDERGAEILDEMEQRTGELPFACHPYKGNVREFLLSPAEAARLDLELERIDPSWSEHLRRLAG